MKSNWFDNLTKAQVEALLECFDFLNNGFVEKATFEVDNLWIIQLQHQRNYCVLRVSIRPDRYWIVSRGKIRKKVMFGESSHRYSLMVNSDRSVGVVRVQ